MDDDLPGPLGYQRPTANNTSEDTANRSLRDIVLSLESSVSDLLSLAQGAPPSSTAITPPTPAPAPAPSSPTVLRRRPPSPASFAVSRDHTDIQVANLRSVPRVLWLFLDALVAISVVPIFQRILHLFPRSFPGSTNLWTSFQLKSSLKKIDSAARTIPSQFHRMMTNKMINRSLI